MIQANSYVVAEEIQDLVLVFQPCLDGSSNYKEKHKSWRLNWDQQSWIKIDSSQFNQGWFLIHLRGPFNCGNSKNCLDLWQKIHDIISRYQGVNDFSKSIYLSPTWMIKPGNIFCWKKTWFQENWASTSTDNEIDYTRWLLWA